VRVTDGGTIAIQSGEEQYKIRLSGIDSPEIVSFRQACASFAGVENGIWTKLAGWRAISSGATSSWYRSFPASAVGL